MPYRRLPKTDAVRLKALKAVIDDDDLYTVDHRVIDWKTLSECKPLYERLYAAKERYNQCLQAQTFKTKHLEALHFRASMFLSHFLQVLFLSIERGEIPEEYKQLYGLTPDSARLPDFKPADSLLEWGPKVIAGEKERIKRGGLPIYNPTIGKVSIHFEIYRDMLQEQRRLLEDTTRSLDALQRMRPSVDAVILNLWNQIEKYYDNLPREERLEACRRLGIVYYNRVDRKKEEEQPPISDKKS